MSTSLVTTVELSTSWVASGARINSNVEPEPVLLVSSIWELILFARRLAIYNPRPVPSVLRVKTSSERQNLSNTFSWSAREMPRPVSCTAI